MSATSMAVTAGRAADATVWQVRRAQLGTVVRLELRKNFLRWRGFWVYLIALGPALIIGMHAIHSMLFHYGCSIDEDTTVLAGIMQWFYLRLGVFFGCMGICTRLFRGDMIERSLHYYFLSPIRREVLVVGKWIAGVTAVSFFFGWGVFLSWFLMYIHHGAAGRDFMLHGAGRAHLAAYLGVTVLAAIGYGALFLLTGLIFRNPIIPAGVILVWESINHILPSMLKKLSVIFYLEPLCPVEVPAQGIGALFSISANPTPAYLAVPGLLLLAAAILAYACWRVRSVEIDYGTD